MPQVDSKRKQKATCAESMTGHGKHDRSWSWTKSVEKSSEGMIGHAFSLTGHGFRQNDSGQLFMIGHGLHDRSCSKAFWRQLVGKHDRSCFFLDRSCYVHDRSCYFHDRSCSQAKVHWTEIHDRSWITWPVMLLAKLTLYSSFAQKWSFNGSFLSRASSINWKAK